MGDIMVISYYNIYMFHIFTFFIVECILVMCAFNVELSFSLKSYLIGDMFYIWGNLQMKTCGDYNTLHHMIL